MRNDCYKKTLVFGIIVLFIGMSAIPSTGNIMVFDDNTPPVTTISFDPPEPDGCNGWYVSDVNVTLNATDDMSGVKEIHYRVNEGEWKVHAGDLVIFILAHDCLIDGIIEFYAVDFAENQEEINSFCCIDIDQLPPYSKNLWYEVMDGNPWQGWDIVVTADNVTDDCSGLDRVEFYLNGLLQATVMGPGPTYTWGFTYHGGLKITIGVGYCDVACNCVFEEIEIKLIRNSIQQSIHPLFLRLIERFPLLERLLNLI